VDVPTALERVEPIVVGLRDGLERVKLLPVGGGFVDVTGGVDVRPGLAPAAFARLEAGLKPLEALTAFGFAETHFQGDLQAGVGLRLAW